MEDMEGLRLELQQKRNFEFSEHEAKENFRKELQQAINKMEFCWVCGRKEHLTKHHAIPQRVKSPLMNLLVPVCENCNCAVHDGDNLARIIRKMFMK